MVKVEEQDEDGLGETTSRYFRQSTSDRTNASTVTMIDKPTPDDKPPVVPQSNKKRALPISPARRSARKRVKVEDDEPYRSPSSSPLTDLEDLPLGFNKNAHDRKPKTERHSPLNTVSMALPNEVDVDVKPSPEKKKKESKKPIIKLKLDKPHPAPPRWERQYELIDKMRKKIVAPVDTLGCDTPNGERTSNPKTVRFHILISLMLSSQTKDPVTSQAVTNLHQTLPSGLTADSLAEADEATISECINKVGFWRRKTEYIQSAAKMILQGGLDKGETLPDGWQESGLADQEEIPGDIPRTLGGLCKLKGVGPKMAFLALQCAWNINAGVGVDVHVHRITNRLGWHKPKTTDPEQTRLNLQSWLPSHLFKPINHVLVGFGQVVCLPVGPRCDVCLLAKEKICPARTIGGNYKGRKEVGFSFDEADEDQKVIKVDEGGEDGLALVNDEEKAKPKVEIKIEEGR